MPSRRGMTQSGSGDPDLALLPAVGPTPPRPLGVNLYPARSARMTRPPRRDHR